MPNLKIPGLSWDGNIETLFLYWNQDLILVPERSCTFICFWKNQQFIKFIELEKPFFEFLLQFDIAAQTCQTQPLFQLLS